MTPFADTAFQRIARTDGKLLEPQQGDLNQSLGVNRRLCLNKLLVFQWVWQGRPPSSILPTPHQMSRSYDTVPVLTSCPRSFTHIRRPSKGISLNNSGLRNSLSTS